MYHDTLPLQYPNNFEVNHPFRSLDISQHDALVGVGLLTPVEINQFISTSLISGKANGAKFTRTIYDLTDNGKKFFNSDKGFCYGKPKLSKIVKWIGPKELGNYKEVDVTYLITTSNVPSWAHDKKIQENFLYVRNNASDMGEEKSITLVLSSNGWEPKVQ